MSQTKRDTKLHNNILSLDSGIHFDTVESFTLN